MITSLSFSQEVSHLLYAMEGSPVHHCIQCGMCTASCPAAEFMDHSPRQIIAMIAANLKDEVLASNSFWFCASCYQCSVRCPRGIHIADMMYALKRYSMWKNRCQEGLIGPDFSRRFAKMIVRTGKSFEPALAPSFILKYGWRGLWQDARTALALFLKGRLPLFPSSVKRVKPFRRMLGRMIPFGEVT